MTCYRQKLTVWPGKSIICKKKHLKIAYFGRHKSDLADFRRTWTPNRQHQVNFLDAPENFGLQRFEFAMWKVGGTKIECKPARYTFYRRDMEIREKVIFWVKHSVPENFQQKKFSGLPRESLRTQDSENIVGLGDRAPVSKL